MQGGFDMRINETVKELRLRENMTQAELAEKLNCNRQKIADWERGKTTPAADDIILLAKIFNVSADYLLGISKVKTNDRDVRFICEYTGLDEESVENLKVNECFKVPIGDNNVFDKRALFMGFAYDKYAEMYRESFDEVIQSGCLLDIVTSCCTEKVYEYCYKEIMQFIGREKPLNTVSKYTIDKMRVYIDIFNDFSKQHLLNMFCAQNSVIEFVKETTVLNDYDSELIKEIKQQIMELEIQISGISSDEKMPLSDYENKKIFGYSIDDIESIVDYYLDHRETKKTTPYDFINGRKAFQIEEECNEYAKRMQAVIEERETDGNNPKT